MTTPNPKRVRVNEGGRGVRGPKQFPTLREARYSHSLERGLAILEDFKPERPLLGIAELADDIGMSRSATHRCVITLRALGFLEQDPSRKYRLGQHVTDLGTSALNSTGLWGHARPHLEELRRRTSFTASISVLDGFEIVYIDRARSFRRGQNRIDLTLRPGSRLPAFCTAMGKILLANLPKPEQRALIGSLKLVRRGPASITSKKNLREELEHVFECGIAVSDEELVSGLVSIACPIRDKDLEVIAALNLEAHTSMISCEELEVQFLSHLLATADNISRRLGLGRKNETR